MPGPEASAMPPIDAAETQRPLHELSQEKTGRLGHLALMGQIETHDNPYAAAQRELRDAAAKGMDVRAEDLGREFDIEKAYEAAQVENTIFDAQVAAIEENKQFDTRAEAAKQAAAPEEQPEVPALKQEPAAQPEAAKAAEAKSEAIGVSPERKAAEDALQAAGYIEQIPTSSDIYTDPATGNVIIAGDTEATVVEAQPGSSPKITKYQYDKGSNKLTIRQGRSAYTTQNEQQARGTKLNQAQTYMQVVTLPPTIAKRFGFERAAVVPA